MKLKLINRTQWSSRDLRKLIMAVFRKEGEAHYRHTVYCEPQKGKFSESWIFRGSRASIGGNYIIMVIPKTFYEWSRGIDGTRKCEEVPFMAERFAQVFSHELDHNKGLRHKEMFHSTEKNCEWARDYEVAKKEVKAKPRMDIIQKRYENTLYHINDKTRKLKRLENQLKKWRQKKLHYEKNYSTRIGGTK